ncbi:MAG: sulfite exporter TauE/SafE family protein [Candidatus Micrarchaeota archaeon]|nr:sulfite exporter TauE/SafE family protein [Candidatus Micrarchaeota archaeon]MDE1848379.1 sulfite exporter TauE/SafE family protein [Candidatus Micrarchaeota archaeon]MDE1864977.1 sulfite exporter TauE/SafE family protein [Candidatus Micrarchaeota archaeon]
MEFFTITTLSAVALGFIVGLLVGLTSVGSGSLMTPILYLDFGSSLARMMVVGTAATQGTITKFVASLRNYLSNTLRTDYVLIISITGVPLAAIGAFFSSALVSSKYFSPFLAVILILAAIAMIVEMRRNRSGHLMPPKANGALRIKGLVLGAVVGLVAGLTGVSTGSLLVTSLIVLLKFPTRMAIGIAIFEGGLILLAATSAQLYLGHVDLPFTGLLVMGGIPGILIGSHFKDRVNQRLLGYGVAGIMIFESLRIISSFATGRSFLFF